MTPSWEGIVLLIFLNRFEVRDIVVGGSASDEVWWVAAWRKWNIRTGG